MDIPTQHDSIVQLKATELLQEVLTKVEMLLKTSEYDRDLIESLALDLRQLRIRLDEIASCCSIQRVPNERFWRLISAIFNELAIFLVERFLTALN